MSDEETPSSPATGDGSLDDLLDSVQNHLQVSIEEDDIPVLTEVVQSAPSIGTTTPDQAAAPIDDAETRQLDVLNAADLDGNEPFQPSESLIDVLPDQDSGAILDLESLTNLAIASDYDLDLSDPSDQALQSELVDLDDAIAPEGVSNNTESTSSSEPLINEINDLPVDEPPVQPLDQIEQNTDLDSITNQTTPEDQQSPPSGDVLAAERVLDAPLDDSFPLEPLAANQNDDANLEEVSEQIIENYDRLDNNSFPESILVSGPEPIDLSHTLEPDPLEVDECELLASETYDHSWADTIELTDEQVELPDITNVDLDDLLEMPTDPDLDENIAHIPRPETEPQVGAESIDETTAEPHSSLDSLEPVAELQPVVESTQNQERDHDPDQLPIFQQAQRLEQIDDLIDQRCQTLATELKLELRSLLDALDSDAD
ncbi:MAG: hypothetical protein JKY89_03030 [Immundisolibacteraceae bacterium]|nr:hypothetical protein [Immundisolibacteraceae bacterium]